MKPTTASTSAMGLPNEGQIDQRADSGAAGEGTGSRPRRGKASRYVRTGSRGDRALTLQVAAMEYIWLYDHRHGVGLKEIAAREHVTVSRVRFGVDRAKAQERKLSEREVVEDFKSGRLDHLGFRLIPLFPIGGFTPQSACPHHDSIERGSRLCCMVCHASGMDDHPGLQRDPQSDPSPEPRPARVAGDAVPSESGKPRETRRQRRRRQFDEAAVA